MHFLIKRLLTGFLALIILCALFVGFHYQQMQTTVNAPLELQGDYTLIVKPGDSLSAISRQLGREGVLSNSKHLRWYVRMSGHGNKISSGEFLLEQGSTALDLLDLLASGKVVQRQLTLVEGWTYREALQAIQAAEGVENTLGDIGSVDLMARLNITGRLSPEGLFFPDSYRYTRGDTDLELLRRSHDRMNEILQTEWRQRSQGLPLADPYEALILASIVEKETGAPGERNKIAGVFVRRLQNNMKLQTDPTVIYGLGERFDGNIRRKHLREDTPYNTYVHRGLTPTPISLPGRDAIRAALHPDDSKYLYFVAKGDGSSYFSETLEEHNRAVRRFQIEQRREDYRSTPNST